MEVYLLMTTVERKKIYDKGFLDGLKAMGSKNMNLKSYSEYSPPNTVSFLDVPCVYCVSGYMYDEDCTEHCEKYKSWRKQVLN